MLQRSKSTRRKTITPDGAQRRAKGFALTGIFMSMFVSMLSMTVVGTSMPVIMGDLGGTQTSLTWVVTASMLASAVSSPIWGKLADLTNKKHLLQLALTLFTLATVFSGFAMSPEWLIGFRVLQGIGIGGLAALGQIVIADVIIPRERGKYMGISSALMASATVGGPLIGGFITDTIGWRWNFFVVVPISIITLVTLQLTLRIPHIKRTVRIDYFGTLLIAIGFSSLLLWVSLVGTQFDWDSGVSIALVSTGVVALVTLLFVETRVKEPVLPLTLFKNRTFTLSAIASLSVGIGLFSSAVFLGQFFQLGQGYTPFESGLLTIPMVVGTLVTSTVAGWLISLTGRWKRYVIFGSAMTLAGTVLMTTFTNDSPYWFIAVAIFLLGAGVGMTMQNLLLIVQNTSKPEHIGVTTSSLNLFRMVGGTTGMAVMGAIVGTQVVELLRERLDALGSVSERVAKSLATDTIPRLADLSPQLRTVFESAYADAIGGAFAIGVPFAVVALIVTIFLPNTPLGTKTTSEQLADQQEVITGKITVHVG